MKKYLGLAFITGVSSLILSLSGCNDPSSALPTAGTYTGFYNGQEITVAVQKVSDTEFSLTLPAPFAGTWDASLKGDAIQLQMPSGSESLSTSKDQVGTFSEQDGKDTHELSWSADEIHWAELGPDHATLGSLDLTRVLSDEVPTLEAPQTYTLEQLIDRAKKRNFESVVEFQKMVLAKDTALNADLRMLPTGNAADALNILSGNTYTELKSIGDLVPFLLPSRWFRVVGTNDQLDAEKKAWTVMDLDGVNYVESFAYESGRDSEALQAILMEATNIQNLRDIVRGEEKAGHLQLGASDPLSSLLKKIQQSMNDLGSIQSNEMAALAQAAGFYNPLAITSVVLPQDPNAPSAGNPITVDLKTSTEIAVSSSVELKQLDDLVAWAKMEKDARYFDWMDPSGNPDGGIGFGIASYIEAGQDQIDEIVAQKEEKKSLLIENVHDAITELQNNVDDYNNAIQAADIDERRVLRQTENLKTGDEFDMNELQLALQDQVNSQLAQIDAQYGYLLALSRFNRLLYQGVYAPATQ